MGWWWGCSIHPRSGARDRRLLGAVLSGGFALLLAAGCWPQPRVAPSPPPIRTPLPSPPAGDARDLPASRAIAALGAEHYARYCTECHGASGAGDGPAAALLDPAPTDFRDAAYMHEQNPRYYFRAITDGLAGSAMAPWDPRLDDEARWDTAFYAWSLATAPGEIERGRDVYAARCVQCHGQAGDGVPTARLNDPARVALSRADVAEAVRRVHPEEEIGDAGELEAVVAYVWTFLYEPAGDP